MSMSGATPGRLPGPGFPAALPAGTAAGNRGAIDIAQLVDSRPVGGFHISLLFWTFLLALLEGYDITAVAFTAPALMRAWNIANPAEFGPVFSATFVGMFFGAPGLGWVADRYGRKPAIIASTLIFGAFTLAAAWASSLPELIVLRALAGIGIGGLTPAIISLNAEYAPRRVRATMVVITITGLTFGGAIPGPVANLLVPVHGWQILYLIGGVIPLVLAAAAAFALPESLKFLSLRDPADPRIARILRRLAPERDFGPAPRFTVPAEPPRDFHLRDLFAGRLRWVTPLLWLLFIITGMVFYFLNSWMPLLFNSIGAPVSRSITAIALFQLGGTVAGLCFGPWFGRYGFKFMTLLYVLACPVVASIGFLATTETALLVVVFLAGVTILGVNFGLNAASGLIYPTAFRANGSGWAFGVARFGSIGGPMIAAALIGAQVSVQNLYLLAVIPIAVAGLCAAVLSITFGRKASGDALTEN
ncbi:MFS transporter [Roseomonas sp. BN140053]|uniref:MFS transporter n=1 Tax=Roseomonas sp. BN140053 TaxID=3391898 RepID=UPI0039E85900